MHASPQRLCGYSKCSHGPDGGRGTLEGRTARTIFCTTSCARAANVERLEEGSSPGAFWAGLRDAGIRAKTGAVGRSPRLGVRLRLNPRRPDHRAWA